MEQNWSLDPKKEQILAKFINHFDGKPARAESIRFLEKKNFSLEGAIELFAANLKWRKENDVDNILDNPPPSLKNMHRIVPYAFHGRDLDDSPVFYERSGAAKYKQFLKCVSMEEVKRLHVYLMEKTRKLSAEASQETHKVVDRFVSVLDLEGLNLGHRALSDCLCVASFIDENYYPNMAKYILLVNVPTIFRVLWPAIRAMLSTEVQERVIVIDNSENHSLLDFIPSDQLPSEYGGSCSRCDGKCIPEEGPVRVESVMLPSGVATQQEKVGARSSYDIEVDVNDSSNLVEWYLRPLEHDLRYRVQWQSDDADEPVDVHSTETLKISGMPARGTERLSGSGTFRITCINTSVFRSNTILHSVRLVRQASH